MVPKRKDGEEYPKPPGSMFSELFAEVALDGDMPWSAALSLDVPEVAALLPMLPLLLIVVPLRELLKLLAQAMI